MIKIQFAFEKLYLTALFVAVRKMQAYLLYRNDLIHVILYILKNNTLLVSSQSISFCRPVCVLPCHIIWWFHVFNSLLISFNVQFHKQIYAYMHIHNHVNHSVYQTILYRIKEVCCQRQLFQTFFIPLF